MMPSKEYARIYEEIRQLMQAKDYAAAYVAVAELQRFAVTNGQILKAHIIEVFLSNKLAPVVKANQKFH